MTDAKRLTWQQLTELEIGTRVRFVEPYEAAQGINVEDGMVATLIENAMSVIVLPDDADFREALSKYLGHVYLAPGRGDDGNWDEFSPVCLEPPPVLPKGLSYEENV